MQPRRPETFRNTERRGGWLTFLEQDTSFGMDFPGSEFPGSARFAPLPCISRMARNTRATVPLRKAAATKERASKTKVPIELLADEMVDYNGIIRMTDRSRASFVHGECSSSLSYD